VAYDAPVSLRAILLLVLAAVHFGYGLFALVAPDRAARWVGLAPVRPAGRGEIRALYGGLLVAVGVVLAWGLVDPWGPAWYLALGLGFAGLAVGRAASLVVDGVRPYTVVAFVAETLVSVLLLWSASDPPA
jgi:hypothetical protein